MVAQVYGRKQIVMERDEVDAIKKFEPPGLHLIGFKPMEMLKVHHHIRPAVFVYPEEDVVKGRGAGPWRDPRRRQVASLSSTFVSASGSSCLFSAMLTKCLEKDVFALCRCVARRNNPPRFAALVPQKEELDEGKVQVVPPGRTNRLELWVSEKSPS